MFRQYFDKLSMTLLSMTLLNMTESCQPEPVEGGFKYRFRRQLDNELIKISKSSCSVYAGGFFIAVRIEYIATLNL